MAMKIQSPGALAPDFGTPLAMLTACHDKVRHFAALSLKLAAHIEAKGCDDEAREPASNILRYFDVAAPLHHADEEEDLFPALRALGEPASAVEVLFYDIERSDWAVGGRLCSEPAPPPSPPPQTA